MTDHDTVEDETAVGCAETVELECGNCGVESEFPLTEHDHVPDDLTEMVGNTIGLTCEVCGHSPQEITGVINA